MDRTLEPSIVYDKVSANTASSVPKCYKKSDGSQDARKGYPDMSHSQMFQKVESVLPAKI